MASAARTNRGVAEDAEDAEDAEVRGERGNRGYRLDLLVERTLIIERKAVHALEGLHTAQLLTYLRLTASRWGS